MAIVVIDAIEQVDGPDENPQMTVRFDCIEAWLDLPTVVDGRVLRGGCGPNTWSA